MDGHLLILYVGPTEYMDLVKEVSGMSVFAVNDEREIDILIPECEYILDACVKIPFDAKRLSRAMVLRAYVAASTGTSHIDVDHLSERNIPVLSLLGRPEIKNITSAAEHSWHLLMAAARNVRASTQHVIDGEWDRMAFDSPMFIGRTLGVIGCGRIGTWMGRYATAFGMNVVGCDPHVSDWEFELADMDEVLSRSDFVTINVALTDDTKDMIDHAQLMKMKDGVILVNTSNGGVINEYALADKLMSGKVAAVGLDVLKNEPNVQESPLLVLARKNPNIVITPHIGGRSSDALKYVIKFCAERIRDHAIPR